MSLGFLHVSLGPDISFIRSPPEALSLSMKNISLKCAEKLSAVKPDIYISWDFNKLVQVLATSEKDSFLRQLWHRCSLYLTKEMTILIKEHGSGKLSFQQTHNFHIALPEQLEAWNHHNLERTLRIQPHLSPDTKYVLLMKVKHGVSIEFQTDVTRSVPVDSILEELGLADVIPAFRNARVDTDSFLLLTEQHLSEMAVPIGYRVKIISKINELRRGIALSNLI